MADSSAVPTSLASLPDELLIEIVSDLSVDDLRSLRATDRRTAERLVAPGSSVSQHYFLSRFTAVQRKICPLECPLRAWDWIIALEKKARAEAALAESIVGVLEANVLREIDAFPAHVADRIRARLAPGLSLLSTHLHAIREIMLETAEIAGAAFTFTDRELEHHSFVQLSQWAVADVACANDAYICLLRALDYLPVSTRTRGHRQRARRGAASDSPAAAGRIRADLLTPAMIHGNLAAVNKILMLPYDPQRNEWIKAFLAKLDPALNDSVSMTDRGGDWRAKWSATALTPHAKTRLITRSMASNVLQTHSQDDGTLWKASATKIIHAHALGGSASTEPVSGSSQTAQTAQINQPWPRTFEHVFANYVGVPLDVLDRRPRVSRAGGRDVQARHVASAPRTRVPASFAAGPIAAAVMGAR